MTARAYVRGYPVVFRDVWIYDDTGQPVDEDRPCARCGRPPTREGHDACLGSILGAIAACCGHGTEPAYILYPEES